MNIQQLTKKINSRIILNQLNFDLFPNELVGLVGRNGSGKTTLFRTIAGHYQPDSGQILIDEKDLTQNPEVKQNIFYIDEQYNFLKEYSLMKIVSFYQSAYPAFDMDLLLELMKKYDLSSHHRYRGMSKGMQGLFQVILAICSNARYVLLDEPFDGLDAIIRKNIVRLIVDSLADSGRTFFIASHNLIELENLADRVLILKERQIVYDYRLEALRQTARKLQLVFKTKKVPSFIKEHSKVISSQGRVWVVLIENYTPELEEKLKETDPLVLEELPLSLEDIFDANLAQKSDYL